MISLNNRIKMNKPKIRVGRGIGALLMNYIVATKYLFVNALMAILMIIVSMNSSGDVAVYSILLVGFFNSIMFPTIFNFTYICFYIVNIMF